MTIEEMKKAVGGDEALKANADIIKSWLSSSCTPCDKTDIIDINEKFVGTSLANFAYALMNSENKEKFYVLSGYDCDIRLVKEESKLKSIERLYEFTAISPDDSKEILVSYCDGEFIPYDDTISEMDILSYGLTYKVIKIFPDEYNFRLHVFVKE